MTTVKEFKGLGVPFIEGDEGNCFLVVNGRDLNDTKLFDSDEVISFAWRPLNTLPDNPKFKYEADNKVWRPLLEQPKQSAYDVDAHVSVAKPVFTQAMADAGELPPVGSEVCFDGENVPVHGYAKSGFPIFEFANGTVDAFNSKSVYTPLDTRTPKQKAVDSAMTAICFDRRSAHTEMVQNILGDAYELGFIKC